MVTKANILLHKFKLHYIRQCNCNFINIHLGLLFANYTKKIQKSVRSTLPFMLTSQKRKLSGWETNITSSNI